MKKTFILLTIGLTVLLAGCVEQYVDETVKATVVEKDHDPATTKKVKKTVDGKVKTTTKRVPAEYDVEVIYQDLELEIDNKKLYNKVKVGDTINVTHSKGLDAEGNIVSEKLIYKDSKY